MAESRYDPDLDDDKAFRTLVGADAIIPESEKQMFYCGNVDCPSRVARSFDPLRNMSIDGRRFYVAEVLDGEAWLCPDCSS